MKQINMDLCKGTYGGRRPGAGRPRKHSPGVAHASREQVSARTPLHINFKYNCYIRSETFLKVLESACMNAQAFEFQVCYYTVQSNHVHLIAEAKNTTALIKGMRSLTNTIVKLLKKGSVQIERYHLHVLKTPRETRNALSYVIYNDLKHTGRMNVKFTKSVAKGKSWLLTSSSKDIASGVWQKFLYP